MRTFVLRLCALACLVLVGTGCASGESQFSSREYDACPGGGAGDARDYYCGTLAEEFHDFVVERVDAGMETLYVTSLGGEVNWTIKAADILEGAGVEIVVREICLSACAQFLFIPASRGRLEKGAVIGLNWTSSSLAAMRLREDWPEYDKLKERLPPGAEKEKAFYRSRGLDEALLFDPMLVMGPVCVSKDVDWSVSEYPKIYFEFRNKWWGPLHEQLLSYGMKPKGGNWIETIGEFRTADMSTQKYNYGGVTVSEPSKRQITTEDLSTLPACQAR